MNVETRKTAAGTEYWDNEEKRVRFVPTGQEPNFEVTENPKSMLDNQKTKTDSENNNKDLESYTVQELRSYSAELGIEIPADIKKKDDIIKFLSDGE